MTSYTTSITPRLRVARNLSLNNDRSVSQIATATEGPSRIPEFSQLVNLNLNEMAPSETSEQSSTSTVPGPSTSTRSENPAAVLRALLSRLPAEPRSPPPAQSPSQQYLSERESDYDMDLTGPANGARSMVQENLKDIFSKARRDPGDTPQIRRDGNTTDEESTASARNTGRDDSKGKRRSPSDDERSKNGSSQRPATRFKHSPQPVTLEFLRERFSDSRFANESVGDEGRPPTIHDFSNAAATTSEEFNSFQTNIPAATSTPQQSLRMSFSSQFQSNLLDQDSEMQHAINELDSYGEISGNRPISPPPISWKRLVSRSEYLTPIPSNSLRDSNKTPIASHVMSRPSSPTSLRSINVSSGRRDYNGTPDLDHDQNDGWGQPRISRGYGHFHSNFESLDEPTPRGTRGQPSVHRPSSSSRDDPSQSNNILNVDESLHSTTPPQSPPYASIRQRQLYSPPEISSKTSFVDNRDRSEAETNSKAEWRQDSPHPAVRPLTPSSVSPPQSANGHLRSNSLRSVEQSKMDNVLRSESSTSAVGVSNLGSSKEESYRTTSPSPSQYSSSSLGRASSLQAIDNIYHNNDPSLQRRLRTPSPLPSSSRVNLKSPDVSKALKKSKFDIPSSNTKNITPSSLRNWSSPHSIEDLSVKSMSSSQSKQPTRISSPWSSRLDSNKEDNDDTRQANLSFQDKTPPGVSDFDEERPVTPPSRAPRLLNAPAAHHILLKDPTSFSNTSQGILLSPLAPRSRYTPKNINKGQKSPSPTTGQPELPAPSSGDESDHGSWNHAVTPRSNTNGGSNSSCLPTPRPPGGWLQTPMPPRTHPSTSFNHETNSDSAGHEPKTPLRTGNTNSGKTPRPPGAWQTPAPASNSAHAVLLDEQAPEGLLTPIPSSSKGLVLDLKTPHVPGGWAATPAARRSILKVRFNQGAQASSMDNTSTPRLRNNDLADEHAANKMTFEDSSAPSSSRPSLRNPQTPNIRIIDAYGRQQESGNANLQGSTPSQTALRVVDSMGREIRESDQTGDDEPRDGDEDYPPLSRTELLSRIRRGLDNLVEDIDDIDKENDACFHDEARIEELNALSIQARQNRSQLLHQASKFQPRSGVYQSDIVLSGPYSSTSASSNRRFYVVMFIVQIMLLLLMYRLAVHRARELFLNSYYDPFNPDLYLYIFKYDTSFHLFNSDFSRIPERSFGDAFLQGGQKAWASCLHLMGDVKSYFWKLWAIEGASLQTTTWAPT